MAERITLIQSIKTAAATAGRVYFAPPTAAERYRLVAVAELPNAASAANATNYATRALFKGSSTALNTAVTTETVSIVQGTAVPAVLTAAGADLEITQASPLSYRITHGASGVAMDVSVIATFDVERV